MRDSTDFELVKLELSDLDELAEVSRATYLDAFSIGNTQDNMELYLNTAFDKVKLAKELKEEGSAFYFSKVEGRTSGYLKINYEVDSNSMELERIYVLKEFQGLGIGRLFMDYVVQKAKEMDLAYVWLGVWEENEKAIAFYKKNGFEIVGTHPFKMGHEIQQDYVMRRNL